MIYYSAKLQLTISNTGVINVNKNIIKINDNKNRLSQVRRVALTELGQRMSHTFMDKFLELGHSEIWNKTKITGQSTALAKQEMNQCHLHSETRGISLVQSEAIQLELGVHVGPWVMVGKS